MICKLLTLQAVTAKLATACAGQKEWVLLKKSIGIARHSIAKPGF